MLSLRPLQHYVIGSDGGPSDVRCENERREWCNSSRQQHKQSKSHKRYSFESFSGIPLKCEKHTVTRAM